MLYFVVLALFVVATFALSASRSFAATSGTIVIKGDYGNPSGSGLAKMHLPDLPDEEHATLETRMTAYHTALKTAQLTSTNQGEVFTTYGDEASAAAPGANVNIDRQLVVTFNRTSDSKVRRHTISGVPATSTGIDLQDVGERLNATGKTALAAALNAVYGYDDIVVLTGKVLQKS